MISRIQGYLIESIDSRILIDVGGVGYELEISATARAELPELNTKVLIYTDFIVRENAQLLFGFASRTERDIFRDLIKINGVGPKLALALVSSITVEQLVQSVQNADISLLTRVPGVGKKTAERLLVELKGRLADVIVVPSSAGRTEMRAMVEAQDALIALGYRPQEAQRAIDNVALKNATTEELLRAALKHSARQVEVAS
jgi:Holliday junction DNA helicase RuvA